MDQIEQEHHETKQKIEDEKLARDLEAMEAEVKTLQVQLEYEETKHHIDNNVLLEN